MIRKRMLLQRAETTGRAVQSARSSILTGVIIIMENRTQAVKPNLDHTVHSQDETLQPKRCGCGRYPDNGADTFLTVRDLYNIANVLRKTIKHVVERYCEVSIDKSSKTPVVRLKSHGYCASCLYLSNRRYIDRNTLSVDRVLSSLSDNTLIMQEFQGPFKPGINVPRRFFQPSGYAASSHSQSETNRPDLSRLPVGDEFYGLWIETVACISKSIHAMAEAKAPTELIASFLGFSFIKLYTDYDTKKELLPQFLKNRKDLMDAFIKISFVPAERNGGPTDGA